MNWVQLSEDEQEFLMKAIKLAKRPPKWDCAGLSAGNTFSGEMPSAYRTIAEDLRLKGVVSRVSFDGESFVYGFMAIDVTDFEVRLGRVLV